MSNEASAIESIASIPPIAPAAPAEPVAKRGPGRPRKNPADSLSAKPDMFGKTTSATAGSDLVPRAEMFVGVTQDEYWYWVGVKPDSLIQWLDCGGINFPKVVWEREPGIEDATPQRGALVKISESQMELMRQKLPRMVIRVKGSKRPNTKGVKDLGKDPEEQQQWWDPIRIPTAEDIAAAKKDGRTVHRYTPQPGDFPAATCMYAVLCDDQENPTRGAKIPSPLSETGLVWPVPV